jgi:adenosylhomocysteine nucleosidase
LIAVLCATPREMACLTPHMEATIERPSPAGMRLIEGSLDGRSLLVLACGVGKVPAAAGSRFFVDHYALDVLVNYGIAGALSPHLRTGDLIIATGVINGDTGVAHSRGFEPTGPGSCEGDGVLFEPHYEMPQFLVQSAQASADQVSLPTYLGKILTCDQVVLDPELRAHLGGRFDALAVEMEGAAAAFVVMGEGIPFFAVRAISDELSHDFVGLEKILPTKGQSRRHLWGKRFLLSITNPATMSRARELNSGIHIALENMATFLRVFLPVLIDHPWHPDTTAQG